MSWGPLRAALGKHVELLERPGVEEVVEAFPGGHLAAECWRSTAAYTSRMERCIAAPLELFQALLHRSVDHGAKASGRVAAWQALPMDLQLYADNVVIGLGGET